MNWNTVMADAVVVIITKVIIIAETKTRGEDWSVELDLKLNWIR